MAFIGDIKAVKKCDPSARYALEIILLYPGMQAIWVYRFAHLLWRIHLKFISRLISQIARFLTGVEIHPAAKIGKNLVIDHGMGVVIGQTAIVGDNCLLYHGVTLGGRVTTKVGRRHPKLGNNVIVGANASILGAIDIADNVKIGADAVVVNDVEQGEVYIGQSAKPTDRGAEIEYYL